MILVVQPALCGIVLESVVESEILYRTAKRSFGDIPSQAPAWDGGVAVPQCVTLVHGRLTSAAR